MANLDILINTPRLVISHLDSTLDSHCDFLVELHADEKLNRESARGGIERDARRWTSGYGRHLIRLKDPQVSATTSPISEQTDTSYPMIGVVSMKFRTFDGVPLAPDVGYALLPAYQKKGYATEAAGAFVKWFEEKGQKQFFGFCDPDNESSMGVLKRLGFQEHGVREIEKLSPDGSLVSGMVFSKGLTRPLKDYGVN